ncbi:hypothetical protein [Streptococcus sp. WB01_FAA12]|uniref:hypothetical protein n=1 Tax=Streptococcus sp. WB01_FAA12 TaxID=2725308 RepID=UPI00146BC9C8|nr:hypothetical protein [Streptococcus sp. WB01_FAA12]
MNYTELQTLYYHSMVQVMTNVFFGIIVFMVIRRMLQNKKAFRMLSIAVLIVPFSILAIAMSILDYVRH